MTLATRYRVRVATGATVYPVIVRVGHTRVRRSRKLNIRQFPQPRKTLRRDVEGIISAPDQEMFKADVNFSKFHKDGEYTMVTFVSGAVQSAEFCHGFVVGCLVKSRDVQLHTS